MIAVAEEPPHRELVERAHEQVGTVAGLVEVDPAEPLHIPIHRRPEPDVLGEREVDAELAYFVLEDVLKVVVAGVKGLGSPVDEPALGPPPIANLAAEQTDITPANEPHRRIELWIDTVAAERITQVPSLTGQHRVEHLAARVEIAEVAVLRADGTEPERGRIIEPEVTVHAAQPAVSGQELAVGDNRPQVRLSVQVVAHPAHEHVGGLAERRVAGIVEVPRRLVVGEQQPKRGVPDLARDLSAVARVNDGPGIHEVHRPSHTEDLLAFEKEGAELGEKQRESLVHFDLRPVRFDLREIRVVGEVQGEIRREPILEIDPAFGLRLGRERGRTLVQPTRLDGGDRRQDLEVTAGRQSGHPVEEPHLREET